MKTLVFSLVILCGSMCMAEEYSRNNYFRSSPNIFGGTDYRSGTYRVRSVPNIHGGYNWSTYGSPYRSRTYGYYRVYR